MVYTHNNGMHDFGYTCFMPQEIRIDGLFVDDSNHPKGYQGMYFFSDPDGGKHIKAADRAFPYVWCKRLQVRGLSTASGKKPRLSSNAQIEKRVVLVEGEG